MGVMASPIRYHDGTFYLINCNFSDKGNFIVTAKDPAGPLPLFSFLSLFFFYKDFFFF